MRKKNKIFPIIILVLTCLVSTLSLINNRSNNIDYLIVNAIDVDQGDSILIKTPDNKTMLVDTGDEKFYRNVMRDLKKNKVKKIDYILGTHSDSDHIGGMDKIIDLYKVDTLVVSKDDNIKPELQQVFKSAHKKNLRILTPEANDSIKFGKYVKIFFLSPKTIDNSDANKNSLVFLLKYSSYNMIFTGDADKDIEKNILNDYNLPKIDLLKAGHHGSKTSSCDEFIRKITPKITIISCGYNNRYRHPSNKTIETLEKYNSKIYRTDKLGSIKFYFKNNGIYVKHQ